MICGDFWNGTQTGKRKGKPEFRAQGARLRGAIRAHALARNRLFVYHFTTQLGRTRPEQMVINSIESTETSIIVRGTLGESSERATLLIGQYVTLLAKDPDIGPHFRKDGINVTSFDRNRATDQQNFEITFVFGPNPS